MMIFLRRCLAGLLLLPSLAAASVRADEAEDEVIAGLRSSMAGSSRTRRWRAIQSFRHTSGASKSPMRRFLELSKLKQLRILFLDRSHVSDAGLNVLVPARTCTPWASKAPR